MPLYEYKCLKCGRHYGENRTGCRAAPEEVPALRGKVESVITAPAIKFKGSGWYVTDYAGKSPDGGSKEKTAPEGKDSGGKDTGGKDSGGKDGGAKDSKDGGSKESSGKDSSAKDTSSKESSSKDKKPAKKK